AGAGLYVQRRVVKLARSLTPQNIAVQAVTNAAKTGGEVGGRVRTFTEEVRVGMAEREAELREAVALDREPPVDPRGRPHRILRAQPINEINDSEDGQHGVG
ncbi:MAG: hypothetical protein ABIQ26_06340, partial [Streptosporangiaceae bacterium]